MKANNQTKDREIKHRSTFAILFYINRTKIRKDGTCQLLCKVSIDAVPAQIGINVSVENLIKLIPCASRILIPFSSPTKV